MRLFNTLLGWWFPVDQSTSFTLHAFVPLLVGSVLIVATGHRARSRRVRWLGGGLGAMTGAVWIALICFRPLWLRLALEDKVLLPAQEKIEWVDRGEGLETADLDVWVQGKWVDRMALVRVDPTRYEFQVHWDPTATRSVREWQKELGAAVVMNGSYFAKDKTPLTPIKQHGEAAGPTSYTSQHGAFVAGAGVEILDLDKKDVFGALVRYPEAMVSYPLLLDSEGHVRAQGHEDWLASRTFVALDRHHRFIAGTTRTGYFSLRRLGEYLRSSALDIQIALNLDGGPIAGQIVQTKDYQRVMIGHAEINHGADDLRATWQSLRKSEWKLPIVLALTPRRQM